MIMIPGETHLFEEEGKLEVAKCSAVSLKIFIKT